MERRPAGPYSPLKIVHHPDRVKAWRAGKTAAPVQVQLVISDLCNQSCGFCAFRMPGYSSNQRFGEMNGFGVVNNNPNRKIPLGKVIEILEDCQQMGVKAIQITGGGEPTVHPHHVEVFEAVHHRNMDLALVSNGVRWTAETHAALVFAKWVRVSIDAGKPETYAVTRNVSTQHFEAAWRNVAMLADKKNGMGTKLRLGVSFVVTRENFREILLAVDRAKEAGADNIRLGAFFQPDGAKYYDGILDEIYELLDAARTRDTPGTFSVLNNFGSRYSDLEQGRPDYHRCWYQQANTYIGGDLNVYRCCTLAYNDAGLLGSLEGKRFRDLWKESQAAMADFDAGGCDRCPFNAQNQAMAYAVDPSPQDVNFV
jgi:MoaA/NifB/PqqE/SkfB family radical SAM enzyme